MTLPGRIWLLPLGAVALGLLVLAVPGRPAGAAAVSAAAFLAAVLALRRRRRELTSLKSGVVEAASGVRPRPQGPVSLETEELLVELGALADVVAAQRAGSERDRLLARTVFEEVPEGLVVVDPKLRLLDANPAARRLFRAGASRPGEALVELVREPTIVRLFEAGVARRGDDAAPQSEIVRLGAEAGRPAVLEVTVRPLPMRSFPGDPAAVGVVRDVTEREKTEDLRRRFLADVSHELRTPIATIRAAAETLAGEEGLGEGQGKLAQIVLRQSSEMEALVSDLIDLSQIEAGAITLSIERVPLEPLLSEVARDLSPAALARGVRVALEASPGLVVRGDRRRFAQVFRNLLDNAIKFSPRGATVDVLAEPAPGARGEGAVAVHVVDRGIGIARSEQERIFHRFYRVDPSRNKSVPGTGLGLAIVKHLLILSGGEISVESAPGSGSRFTVHLPAAAPVSAAVEEPT